MTNHGAEVRILEAQKCMKDFGLGDTVSLQFVIRIVKQTLIKRANIYDDDLVDEACSRLYEKMTSDLDMCAYLYVASERYSKKNSVSVNEATVLLMIEMTIAAAAYI